MDIRNNSISFVTPHTGEAGTVEELGCGPMWASAPTMRDAGAAVESAVREVLSAE